MVEITNRHAAALTVDGQRVLPERNRCKTAVPVATEPKTTAGVIPAFRGGNAKKVLGDKDVFGPVAIVVSKANEAAEEFTSAAEVRRLAP